MNTFESHSTASLTKRMHLSTFALRTVWIGASLAIVVAVIKLGLTGGATGATTLVVAVLAALASLPVYFERSRINRVLLERQTF